METNGNIVTSRTSKMFNSSTAISENGWHIGVLFNNTIFCNVHPGGMTHTAWFNDFIGTGNMLMQNWGQKIPEGPWMVLNPGKYPRR